MFIDQTTIFMFTIELKQKQSSIKIEVFIFSQNIYLFRMVKIKKGYKNNLIFRYIREILTLTMV